MRLDQRPVRVCGIAAICSDAAHHGADHTLQLVERLLNQAASNGAALALLFWQMSQQHGRPDGFEVVPTTEVELSVAESSRHGAPMALSRGGEQRDLPAIVAMGQVRASAFRFHLDRDIDFVQHAITKKRLLAGLGPAGTRQLHFFIAEEGITAAAYVVVSIIGSIWTIEECGAGILLARASAPSRRRSSRVSLSSVARQSVPGCLPASYLRRSRSCLQSLHRK
jgi:hypothetical protein